MSDPKATKSVTYTIEVPLPKGVGGYMAYTDQTIVTVSANESNAYLLLNALRLAARRLEDALK